MKIKHLTFALLILAALGFGGFYSIFTIPEKPQIISTPTAASTSSNSKQWQSDWYCHQTDQAPPAIDDNGKLNVLVWNIHKQGDKGWQQELDKLSRDTQLIMLQEASLTDELKAWVSQQSWGASYVNAFKAFDVSAGVVNLAAQMPNRACAYTAVEPWILLPKSALYARYTLSNGQDLVVINLHSINFTLGTEDFEQQIAELENAVKKHQGLMIIAGDFNTWRDARLELVQTKMAELQMQEVSFNPDHRRRFINDLAFDHVFYRGLKLQQAGSPETSASDHSPMLVDFELEK